MLLSLLGALGHWIGRHPRACVVAWCCLVALAAPFASRLDGVLSNGAGALPGSRSLAVERLLERDFANPYLRSLVVTFHAPARTVDDPAYERAVRACARALGQQAGVSGVQGYYDARDARLRSADGHDTIMAVGLRAGSMRAEEALVPVVRAAIAPFNTPALQIRVTGRAAINVDISSFNAQELNRAEARALPLVLALLLLAFGSLGAAGIPLAVGMAATAVTMGLLYGVGQLTELSLLAKSIVSMLGLALGVDYALLMVNRFRGSLREGLAPLEAASRTLGTAGVAVLFSGLTVLVGLGGLLASPVLETRAVGIGGVLVVAWAVLAALTLVPALLVLIGPGIDWPRGLARTLDSSRSLPPWRRWARAVVDRPVRGLSLSVGLLILLALPATHYVAGFPDRKWLPPALESRQGMDVLDRLAIGWSVFPINLVVSAPDDRPIIAGAHLGVLLRLSRELNERPEVSGVQGPVDLKPGLGPLAYAMLYAKPQQTLRRYPDIERLYLSRDHRSALIQVTLKNRVSLVDATAFVGHLQALTLPGGERLQVGGQHAYYRDFDAVMARSAPVSVAFVLLATYALLFLAFRSYVLPLKAIVLNLLSVGAGLGAMVAVFQLGWGVGLVGLAEPVDAIPQSLVLIVFCVVFGLSMDYEVFLLARIKEAYDASGDNRAATIEGLALTGGVITSAALIMIVVFAAFIGAAVPVVKMVGFGLAVAVLVDATLVRCLAAPAFMSLAGRWNWLPGRPK